MKFGFWHVQAKEEDGFKTTFQIPAYHYEWYFEPFGLKHIASKFQKFMD